MFLHFDCFDGLMSTFSCFNLPGKPWLSHRWFWQWSWESYLTTPVAPGIDAGKFPAHTPAMPDGIKLSEFATLP
jgi:hypothetical protein